MARQNYLLGLLSFLACIFAVSEAKRQGRIIGGDLASAGQFPCQVSLQHHRNENLCGGCIIGERFVVTAAHCVYNDKENKFDTSRLTVVAGVTTFSRSAQKKIMVQVEEVFIPKEYDPTIEPQKLSAGDIAVVKLVNDIGLKNNRYAAAIKLPKKDDAYKNVEATISGFGWVSIVTEKDPKTGIIIEKSGTSYGRLNYAKAKVMSLADCQKKYPNAPPSSKHLCASVVQRDEKEPEGVCKGDSGSPLIHDNTMIGVLSTSPKGCSEKEKPAIYTKVFKYLDFIEKVVQGKIDKTIRSQKLAHA